MTEQVVQEKLLTLFKTSEVPLCLNDMCVYLDIRCGTSEYPALVRSLGKLCQLGLLYAVGPQWLAWGKLKYQLKEKWSSPNSRMTKE